MMNRTQLTKNLQTSCSIKLILWRKYHKNALYRHTEGFVQWLFFDTSEFDVATRQHYSIQALATQFPTVDLTLGDRTRDRRGAELWIKPDDWRKQGDEIVQQIIQQIDPSALELLTIEAISEFL